MSSLLGGRVPQSRTKRNTASNLLAWQAERMVNKTRGKDGGCCCCATRRHLFDVRFDAHSHKRRYAIRTRHHIKRCCCARTNLPLLSCDVSHSFNLPTTTSCTSSSSCLGTIFMHTPGTNSQGRHVSPQVFYSRQLFVSSNIKSLPASRWSRCSLYCCFCTSRKHSRKRRRKLKHAYTTKNTIDFWFDFFFSSWHFSFFVSPYTRNIW